MPVNGRPPLLNSSAVYENIQLILERDRVGTDASRTQNLRAMENGGWGTRRHGGPLPVPGHPARDQSPALNFARQSSLQFAETLGLRLTLQTHHLSLPRL